VIKCQVASSHLKRTCIFNAGSFEKPLGVELRSGTSRQFSNKKPITNYGFFVEPAGVELRPGTSRQFSNKKPITNYGFFVDCPNELSNQLMNFFTQIYNLKDVIK